MGRPRLWHLPYVRAEWDDRVPFRLHPSSGGADGADPALAARPVRMSAARIRDGLQAWWRPLLTLLCLPAAPYALYIGPVIGRPLSDAQMTASLAFVATLYAIREWGKVQVAKEGGA